jgi:hypothetical protein
MSAMINPSPDIFWTFFERRSRECEPVQRYFNDVFGFRPWNQNVGRNFKFESPEFLFSGEVLHRNASRPLFEKRNITLRLRITELIFRM